MISAWCATDWTTGRDMDLGELVLAAAGTHCRDRGCRETLARTYPLRPGGPSGTARADYCAPRFFAGELREPRELKLAPGTAADVTRAGGGVGRGGAGAHGRGPGMLPPEERCFHGAGVLRRLARAPARCLRARRRHGSRRPRLQAAPGFVEPAPGDRAHRGSAMISPRATGPRRARRSRARSSGRPRGCARDFLDRALSLARS